MKTAVRTHVAALALLLPLGAATLATPAAAQVRVAMPTIATLSLDSSHGLAPGSTLRVQVHGTPGARWADVTLSDSGVRVPLREQSPGHYVGSYVVRHGVHIDPSQTLLARAAYGRDTYAVRFNYPPEFQALAMGAAPSALAIERFVVRPNGRIEPGRELRFRLHGAPNAYASVDIPGVARNIELDEIRPGVYHGRYTVRQRDDLDAFRRAVATLEVGRQRVTARVDLRDRWDDDDRRDRFDRRGPQISDLTPSHGEWVEERGRTHLSARLSDDGSGVDPASVRLRVNGHDVTGEARVSADEVHFRDRLPEGRHTAELTVRDRAGNTSTQAWTFVVDRDRDRYARRDR